VNQSHRSIKTQMKKLLQRLRAAEEGDGLCSQQNSILFHYRLFHLVVPLWLVIEVLVR